jgi:2-polyprenyl-3-methyl-5-hydroxy-6-metoxy-1,4-benzoquinol methylase
MIGERGPEIPATMAPDGGPIELVAAPCPRCGAPESRTVCTAEDYLHAIPGRYGAAECQRCGLWYQDPRPTAAALERLYPADYLPHATPTAAAGKSVLHAARLSYLRRHLGYEHLAAPGRGPVPAAALPLLDPVLSWAVTVGLIPRYVPDGRLLEIGCGSGSRLQSLRRLGWSDLHGIELVPRAAEQARADGFAVESGPIEELIERSPDGSFDVVISSMVLEHLLDPFAVVAAVARKLKPGGQFLFSTVNRDSVDAWLYGRYWGGFDFPRHMVYFRKQDLYVLLQPAFEDIRSVHQSAPIDFVRSSQWRGRQGQWLDRLIVRLAGSRLGAALSLLLAWLGLTTRVSFRCRRRSVAGAAGV